VRRRSLLLLALAAGLLAGGPAASSHALQDGRHPKRPFWKPDRVLDRGPREPIEVRALVQFDVDPDDEQDPAGKDIAGLQDAFFAFLQKKPEGRAEPFQRFRRRPFMSLRVTRGDLDLLEANNNRIEFGGRDVRVRVEPTPLLTPNSAGAVAGTPVSELLAELGDDALTERGNGTVLVVIDSGIDPTSGALHGYVVDGGKVAGASPTCGVSEADDNPAGGAGDDPKATEPSHGTRVAGLCSYIAPGAELVSIRVGDASGAAATDVIAALQEVACRWSVEHPVVAAVVLTLTSTDVSDVDYPSHRELMEKAILELQALDIPVVISAGNDSFTGQLAFPADLESSIAVGGLGRDLGRRLTASNWDESLDFCAPAAAVGLQVDWMETPFGVWGTSFSPPFVAGVLARLRERYPDGRAFEDFLPILQASGVPVEVVEAGVTIAIPRLDVPTSVALLDEVFGAIHTSPDPDPDPDPEPEPEPEPEPVPEPVPEPLPEPEPAPEPAPEPEPEPDDGDACTCDGSCGCECGCGTS